MAEAGYVSLPKLNDEVVPVKECLKQQEADMENCGIDVAMKSSSVCILGDRGEVLLEEVVFTDEAGLESVLKGRGRMRCVLEAGPLAEWLSRILERLGHEAVVIGARKARGVIRTKKKTDRLDARNLARMGRTGWYTAVHRKSVEARATRTFLQARQGLVQTVLAQGSRIRGLLRAHGIKLGEVKESQFASEVRRLACEKGQPLWEMLEPLVQVRRVAPPSLGSPLATRKENWLKFTRRLDESRPL